MKYSSIKERQQAYYIVWSIITIILFFILLFPFIAKDNIVLKVSPTCISVIKYHRECPMCGMTRSFIEISHCKFSSAFHYNRGSIFLYIIFLLNIVFYTVCTYKRFKNTK
jgi:hypothetical protein